MAKSSCDDERVLLHIFFAGLTDAAQQENMDGADWRSFRRCRPPSCEKGRSRRDGDMGTWFIAAWKYFHGQENVLLPLLLQERVIQNKTVHNRGLGPGLFSQENADYGYLASCQALSIRVQHTPHSDVGLLLTQFPSQR